MAIRLSTSSPSPIVVADEQLRHGEARETLLDAAFGDERFAKTCERLREGRLPAEGLALVALQDDRLVGTVRLWNVTLGPRRPALMLGPLAVDGTQRAAGIGGLLMRTAIARAAERGHGAIILVGDAPYYERFGFSPAGMERLWLPGPVDRARFLGRDLRPDALAGGAGLVSPTGLEAPRWISPELAGAWRIAA